MKKIKYILSILIISLSLFACKNFCNGGQLISELEDSISSMYKEYIPVLINVASDVTKEMLPPANLYKDKYALNDIIELSFTENDDYKFLYWEAEPIDSVEFISNDNEENEYKNQVTAKIVKNYDLITIKPVVTERPKVIIYSPMLSSEGSDRDTKINIIFNKAVEKESIYFTQDEIEAIKLENENVELLVSEKEENQTYGYKTQNGQIFYKNIKIFNKEDQTNLLEYFDEPILEEPDKLLISVKSDNFLEIDINISVQINNFFFIEENTKQRIVMFSEFEWFFKINQYYDSKAPSIPKGYYINLYGLNYENKNRQITTTELPDVSTENGKKELNQILLNDNNLTISALIFDEGIGIEPQKGFFIKIAKIYDSNLTLVTNNENVIQYFACDTKTQNAKYEIEISFASEDSNNTDGIYKLDFYAQDKNGNVSEVLQTNYIFVNNVAPEKIQNPLITYNQSADTIIVKWQKPDKIYYQYCKLDIKKEYNGNTFEIVKDDKIIEDEYFLENINTQEKNANYIFTLYPVNYYEKIGNPVELKISPCPVISFENIQLSSNNFNERTLGQSTQAKIVISDNQLKENIVYQLKVINSESNEILNVYNVEIKPQNTFVTINVDIPYESENIELVLNLYNEPVKNAAGNIIKTTINFITAGE